MSLNRSSILPRSRAATKAWISMALAMVSLVLNRLPIFSPGKRRSMSLRTAIQTPLCAILLGVIGMLNASSKRLPTTALARMSWVLAGLARVAPSGGGGIGDHGQQAGVRHALGIVDHLRVGADRLDWRHPRAGHVGGIGDTMAATAVGVIQFLAAGEQFALDGPDAARPFWRFERHDFFFKCLQTRKVCGILAVVDTEETLFRFEVGEDPVDLPGIAPEPLNIEPVWHAAIPLRVILLWRIPQKGVADRCVGDFEVRIKAEIAAGDAIEDHAEGIEPPRPPGGRGKALGHKLAELLHPRVEAGLELGRPRS